MTSAVATYYDAFRDRLLTDYREGNPRVSAALEFAKISLVEAKSVLDVGCGIGWTTSELAAAGYEVTGLDLSPSLIATARELFDCEFVEADFVEADLGAFDAVLMVDVYEHFRREQWPRVHERIGGTQAKRVILTVPTPKTQQYARDNGIPLQIIDEDVTGEDIARLAGDIGGVVVIDHLVSIYRPGDYRHVLVRR